MKVNEASCRHLKSVIAFKAAIASLFAFKMRWFFAKLNVSLIIFGSD